MVPPAGPGADQRERLTAIRAADSLADLVGITDADSEHEAYFAAKREWRDLREAELAGRESTSDPSGTDGLPGTSVVLDGTEFRVHGVTHADTRAEREFLREHVSRFVDAGHAVYCEQGIRSMYFDDWPAVCAMDDYSWAMQRHDLPGTDPDLDVSPKPAFESLGEDVDSLAARLRDAAFSVIDAGGTVYGDEFEATLGAVATDFLASHEDLATGGDFESFAKTRRAARDPTALGDLQAYYETTLLPQPLEREWLRRHDPELELLTYARNERMADYLVYHHEDAPTVHAVVGAAHQPGVTYYLRAYRDGRRSLGEFEPVG